MTPLIILGLVAGIPIVLALVFRVNAVFLFLSVAAGRLMVMSVSDDADLALGMALSSADTGLIAKLGLQLAPVAFTLLFLRKTIPMHKLALHLVPIITTGLALAALTIPLLPQDMSQQILDSSYGHTIEAANDAVIGLATLLTLLLAWFSYRNIEKHGKK